MRFRKVLILLVSLGLLGAGVHVFGQEEGSASGDLEQNWKDFLHYANIGLIDVAKGYGQAIIEGNPDPLALLELSEENPQAYKVLLRMIEYSDELREVSGKILEIIEEGRFLRRTDPKIILQEIDRLSTTIRGRLAAEERLKNAGEYAVPFMIQVLSDPERKDEFAYVGEAMAKIGREAIRPLAVTLQSEDIGLKVQVVRVLGEIGYPQALGYLKMVAEKTDSEPLRQEAKRAIEKIDPAALKISAGELFFALAEQYYDHGDAVAPPQGYDFANVWFWQAQDRGLTREEVDLAIFHELMAMRCCELALQADPNIGKAIALWLASFFKMEATGVGQPDYFGQGHADAMTYATTAGPEYLHAALERALKDKNDYVALQTVEALAANAGEKSLMYTLGTEQPLVKALSYGDVSVRYSAAIAIGGALPNSSFVGSELIIRNLAEAVTHEAVETLGQETLDAYAMRALDVMRMLAITENPVVDVAMARDTLIAATGDDREAVRMRAGEILARLSSPDAQRAIFAMAMNETNSQEVRLSGFSSLTLSAKRNGNLLEDKAIKQLYAFISSTQTEPTLRSAAAMSFGALNLPSRMVKDLILDQAKR